MRAQNEIQQRQVATMEAIFARIRQATGVNTLEEMVLKLANQSTNHTTLEEEKREAESKLARAKEARQSEDTRFSYMKASGVGNTELNRDISDKLNNDIQEYRVEVSMNKPESCWMQPQVVTIVKVFIPENLHFVRGGLITTFSQSGEWTCPRLFPSSRHDVIPSSPHAVVGKVRSHVFTPLLLLPVLRRVFSALCHAVQGT